MSVYAEILADQHRAAIEEFRERQERIDEVSAENDAHLADLLAAPRPNA